MLPTYSDHARALLTQIENRYPDDGKQLMATYSSCFLGNISDSALPMLINRAKQKTLDNQFMSPLPWKKEFPRART